MRPSKAKLMALHSAEVAGKEEVVGEVLDDDGSLPWGTPVEEAGSAAVPVTVVGQPAGGLAAQVGQIKEFLQLDAAMTAPVALREANAQMGLPCEGTLPEQAAALIAALGI